MVNTALELEFLKQFSSRLAGISTGLYKPFKVSESNQQLALLP